MYFNFVMSAKISIVAKFYKTLRTSSKFFLNELLRKYLKIYFSLNDIEANFMMSKIIWH